MNYIQEVADLFSARYRESTILSPMDYAIIAEWQKQEIPLYVVLECINQICEGREDDVKIDSIGYFKDAVRTGFRKWLQEQNVDE